MSARIGGRPHSRRSRWQWLIATASIIAAVAGAVGCGGGSSGEHRSAWNTLRPLAGLGGEPSLAPDEGVVLAKLPYYGGETLTIRGKKALEEKPRPGVLIGYQVNGRRGEAEQSGSYGFRVGQGGAASLATEQSCVNGGDIVLMYGLVWQRQYEVHASRDGIERTFRKVMLPAYWRVSGALVVAVLSEARWRVVVTAPHGEVVMRERRPTQLCRGTAAGETRRG